MADLNEAWETLSDTQQRAAYDRQQAGTSGDAGAHRNPRSQAGRAPINSPQLKLIGTGTCPLLTWLKSQSGSSVST